MTKEELGDLIVLNKEGFYRIAKTILTDDADCADAISAAIVKAFAHFGDLKKDKYAKTWFVRILINECYAVSRQLIRVVKVDPLDMPDYMQHEREDYSDLYEAIHKLPEGISIVITLYYVEGYRIKEIAEMLDLTQSAVKNRMLRGRKRLKELLEGREGVQYESEGV